MSGISVTEDAVNLYYYLKAKSTVSRQMLDNLFTPPPHYAVSELEREGRGQTCNKLSSGSATDIQGCQYVKSL